MSDPIAELVATAKTLTALLHDTMNVLHDIGGAYQARNALRSKHLTEPLRQSMRDKAWSDEQIEKASLDTWERVAMALHALPTGGVEQK